MTKSLPCWVLTGAVGLLSATAAMNADEAAIASALSAGPPSITDEATIKTMEGEVLREGSNGWTCYAGTETLGAMCNDDQWDAVLAAYMNQEDPQIDRVSVSYMLAGDPPNGGVSNIDPFATEPTEDNQWVAEGPHLMVVVPDQATLEGLSTDPEDPVYVMWKDTPYAHIMVKVPAETPSEPTE